jgi:hypothetical protein
VHIASSTTSSVCFVHCNLHKLVTAASLETRLRIGTEMPMFMQRDRICARTFDHHYVTQYHRPFPSAKRRHESMLLSFQPEANTEDGFNLLLPKPIPASATTSREILVRFTDTFPSPHVVVPPPPSGYAYRRTTNTCMRSTYQKQHTG